MRSELQTVPNATYERLQRWRRRESKRWPGLFSPSLTTTPSAKGSHEISLVKLRNAHYSLLIDENPVSICDGCGSLMKVGCILASSDSTLPPSRSQDARETFRQCQSCRFPTPVGPLRRLLGLQPCGPEFSTGVALSLLIEAIGIELALKERHPDLHSWFLDRSCRIDGMDAMMTALGIHEEQLCDSSPLSPYQDTISFAERQYILDAETFLRNSIPDPMFPPLPFTITSLLGSTCNHHAGLDAANRSNALIGEATRIWRNIGSHDNRGLRKVKALGAEFLAEQMRARKLNHSGLRLTETIRVTQRNPSQRQSRGAVENE